MFVLLKEKKNNSKAFEDELLKIETEKLNAYFSPIQLLILTC